MSFYDVVKPCVVGKLHYARPTAQPIEVDDDVAAPLVESGCLEPYRPGGVVYTDYIEGVTITDNREAESQAGEEIAAALDDEPPTDPPPRRSRGRRSEG